MNFGKILRTPFLHNPSNGRFCLITYSVYSTTTSFCLFQNDNSQIFQLINISAKYVDLEQQ